MKRGRGKSKKAKQESANLFSLADIDAIDASIPTNEDPNQLLSKSASRGQKFLSTLTTQQIQAIARELVQVHHNTSKTVNAFETALRKTLTEQNDLQWFNSVLERTRNLPVVNVDFSEFQKTSDAHSNDSKSGKLKTSPPKPRGTKGGRRKKGSTTSAPSSTASDSVFFLPVAGNAPMISEETDDEEWTATGGGKGKKSSNSNRNKPPRAGRNKRKHAQIIHENEFEEEMEVMVEPPKPKEEAVRAFWANCESLFGFPTVHDLSKLKQHLISSSDPAFSMPSPNPDVKNKYKSDSSSSSRKDDRDESGTERQCRKKRKKDKESRYSVAA